MIEFLRGTVLVKEDNRAVLDVNGVGYGAELTSGAWNSLPEKGAVTELHVYLYVQEGVMRMYGFSDRGERSLFEMFLGTSGIGPKTALAILSSSDANSFARAIVHEDLKVLTSIPGIGRKTAERLIIELREKVRELATKPSPSASDRNRSHGSGICSEATAALEALGCKPLVAERAIQKAVEVLGSEASVSDLVREGLKHRR